MNLYFAHNGQEYSIGWTNRAVATAVKEPTINFYDSTKKIDSEVYRGEDVKEFARAFFKRVMAYLGASAPENVEDAVIDELYTLIAGAGLEVRKG